MDSWKHCPECNDELTLQTRQIFPFYCRRCNETYARDELELLYEKERDAKRLAAVRELAAKYRQLYSHYNDPDCSSVLKALAAVWPEAVEQD